MSKNYTYKVLFSFQLLLNAFWSYNEYVWPVNQEGLLKFVLFLIIVCSTAVAKDYDRETFCQDINTAIQKIHIHSFNISNIKTTRTSQGGHFKRKLIKSCNRGHCVITEVTSSPLLIFDPSHPDARENGYVAYPSFSIEDEQNKLQKAQSIYQVVLGAYALNPKDLLIGNKYAICFKKFRYFKDKFDYKAYLGR